MYQICSGLGKSWKKSRYVILGDDVLIGDPWLAEAYMEFIEGIGVKYAKLKTYKSKWICEFAKRLHFGPFEISPFPISSIVDNARSVPLVVSSMIGEERKGLRPVGGMSAAVRDLDSVRRRSLSLPQRKDSRPKTARICEIAHRLLVTKGEPSLVSELTKELFSYYEDLAGKDHLWSEEVAPRL